MGEVPLNGLSLPVGANPGTDQTVGWDELGRPVKRSMFGAQYVIETQAPGPSRGQTLRDGYNALVRDPGGTIGGAVGNAAASQCNGNQR